MLWFLLLVVSSMGDEANLQPLPRATHLPTCDIFLAPSTIPGSACMDTKKKPNVISRAVLVATVQILYLELLGRIGDILNKALMQSL